MNYNTTLDYNLRAHAASKYLMRWFLDSIRVGEIQTRARVDEWESSAARLITRAKHRRKPIEWN